MLVCPNLQQPAKSYNGSEMAKKASKGPEDFRPRHTYQAFYENAKRLIRGAN
jgi:hypothetical protein